MSIFKDDTLLEAMLQTDKQFLANSDDAVVKCQLTGALEDIKEIPSEIDTKISLDSVRIFSFRDEKFYIEINEIINVQEEFQLPDVVEALKTIVDYYSTKVDISLTNTYVVIKSADLYKIVDTPELQKKALVYIKFLTDAGVNLVKK